MASRKRKERENRHEHDFTDDDPDAHVRPDPMAGVPRWMRADVEQDSEMSDDFAFLGGRDPQQPRGGGGGKRKRQNNGDWQPSGGGREREREREEDDAEADFMNNFGDGNTTSSGGGTTASSFSSMPSEIHEPPGGGRGRRKKGGAFESDDKDYKKEKGIHFVAKDFDVSRVLNGETLRASKREKEFVKNLGNPPSTPGSDQQGGGAQPGGRDTADGPEAFYQRCKKMAEGDDNDEEAFDTDGGRLDPQMRQHINCPLCKYASVGSSQVDRDFMNAFELMTDLEIEKYGYAHNVVLHREMRDVFNAHQQMILERGGTNVIFVTAEEVTLHFMHHEICNPLRLIGEQVIYLRDTLRRARPGLFGTANDEDFWNKPAQKQFLAVQKQFKDFVLCFTAMRAQMNIQAPWIKMRSPANMGGRTGKPSRHLAGAPQRGKFTNEFMV